MRFSIIVPTYRRPLQLRAALRAVSALEYPCDDFEVVVVDDGASTETAAVVASFESSIRVRYVAQPVRQGPARARNVGASIARGVYLAFLDDDCEPAADWLARYDDAIHRANDIGVGYGGRTLNAESASLYGVASQNLVDFLYEWYNADSEHSGFFATNNMVCARATFIDMGGFDESFRYAAAEDRDFCDRWREQGRRLVYVPTALVHHHQRVSLKAFVKQHAGYGRGAVDLHETRDKRGVRRPRLEPAAFYMRLIAYPARHASAVKLPALVSLALLSQGAYALGFFRERWRRRGQPANSTSR